MKILILYGTTEGQTRKVAQFVADQLQVLGDAVTLVDAANDVASVNVRDFDAVIVAASLHAGVYQGPVIHFARANHAWLNLMPTAFLSVSLSAAGNELEDLKGIADCADRFKAETNWTTPEVHHVAGAFRFAEYDFFKRWVMKLIAWERNVKVEPGKNLELTNWEALSTTVDAIRARFADAKPRKTA